MAGNGRRKNGRFAKGNSFAKGHGAPPGNQNAKGHGAPARNTNAVKTGVYMRYEEGETPYDRLRGGESEIKRLCIDMGHILWRFRREYRQEKAQAKS